MSAALDVRHSVGANNPPGLILPTPAEVKDHLEIETLALRQRGAELKKMVEDYLAELREITNDEEQGRAADVVAQIKAHLSVLETRRKAAKNPWNQGGDAVQAYFAALVKRMPSTDAIVRQQTVYAVALEARKREAAERARRIAEREAAEAMAALEEGLSSENLDMAEAAVTEASKANALATAKAADLSRTQSDLGVTTSLRTKLVIEVTDVTKLPVQYLLPNETAIRAAVQAAKKIGQDIQIPGVRIIWEKQAANYAR